MSQPVDEAVVSASRHALRGIGAAAARRAAWAERLYGWTAQEAIGRSVTELETAHDVTDPEPVLAALHRDGRWDSEYPVRRKDGTSFPADLRNRVMLDQDGDVKAFVSVSMDISDRKESERALLSARNYLRAVTDSMGEGVYAADTEGRLTYANQAAEDLLGWTLGQLQGLVMHDIAHNRSADGSPLPIEECPISHAWRDGRAIRVEDDIFIRRDGSELPVAYTATPFATEDGVEGCVVRVRGHHYVCTSSAARSRWTTSALDTAGSPSSSSCRSTISRSTSSSSAI